MPGRSIGVRRVRRAWRYPRICRQPFQQFGGLSAERRTRQAAFVGGGEEFADGPVIVLAAFLHEGEVEQKGAQGVPLRLAQFQQRGLPMALVAVENRQQAINKAGVLTRQ